MWEFKPRVLAKSPGLCPLGDIDIFRRVGAKMADVWAETHRRNCCASLAWFFTAESSYCFHKYGLLNQTMVQNLIWYFHRYWTDMFQGRHFLGI